MQVPRPRLRPSDEPGRVPQADADAEPLLSGGQRVGKSPLPLEIKAPGVDGPGTFHFSNR